MLVTAGGLLLQQHIIRSAEKDARIDVRQAERQQQARDERRAAHADGIAWCAEFYSQLERHVGRASSGAPDRHPEAPDAPLRLDFMSRYALVLGAMSLVCSRESGDAFHATRTALVDLGALLQRCDGTPNGPTAAEVKEASRAAGMANGLYIKLAAEDVALS